MHLFDLVAFLGREDKNEGRAVGGDTSIQDTLTLQDLPVLKFETLAIATDNFSEANKLGKGGFGPVYKVFMAISSISCYTTYSIVLFEQNIHG